MSTTTKMSRGKPVTLATSASGEPVPAKASANKTSGEKTAVAKTAVAKPVPKAKSAPVAPKAEAAPAATPLTDAIDPALAAKWNELFKAQSEAALAWWQDAQDARTLADAIAVNARHSRVQFELAAGQAREMAAYFQKTFEGNAERIRALMAPRLH